VWRWNEHGGHYTFFTVPGAGGDGSFVGGTYSSSINDVSDVVGLFTDTNMNEHGFINEGEAFTIIDVPGADETQIYWINNKGDIGGEYYVNSTGIWHGFVLSHGRYTTVDYPGETFTWIQVISDSCQLAGCYGDDLGIFHGFVASPTH